MRKYELAESLLMGELSDTFYMLRAKDKDCYSINTVALPSLSDNVFGLCNQLNNLNEVCFNYTETHGFSEFYKIVHLCNAIVMFEGSDLENLYGSFVVNFEQVFSNCPNLSRFSIIFPKTYKALLNYNNIMNVVDPLDKDNELVVKHLLDSGIVEQGFDLFQHLLLRLCNRVFVHAAYQGYGKDGHVYTLVASPSKSFNPEFKNLRVTAKTLVEAKLKFAMMYLMTELVTCWDSSLPIDNYTKSVTTRFKEIKKGLINGKKQ